MQSLRIRIDKALWESASDVRRREWSVLIADALAGDSPFPHHPDMTIRLGGSRDEVTVAFLTSEDAAPSLSRSVARAGIEAELKEYLDVIDRLEDENVTLARAEALDMAKRVVHDAAARRLGELLPEIGPGLEERRRFFSLCVSLFVDTTGKKATHRHL